MKNFIFTCFLASCFFATTIHAKPKAKNQFKRLTIYNFEKHLIDGDLLRPDGDYFESRPKTKHIKLFKLRKHWKKRLTNSIDVL